MALLRGSVSAVALVTAAQAQNATWGSSPPGNDFTNGANWSGGNAPTGTATFGSSSKRTIVIPGSWAVDAMQFNASAPAYTFNINDSGGGPSFFVLTGAGIVNNSSNAPTFNVNSSLLQFAGNATAGNAVINSNVAAISFVDNASAGSATINVSDGFSVLSFDDNSKAGNAKITVSNGGGTQFAGSSSAQNATIKVLSGSELFFANSATAGAANILVNGISDLGFIDNSTAGNATIRAANDGLVVFLNNSTGGKARFIASDGGVIDFSGSFGQNGKVTAGSIEGAGIFIIGDNFVVGGNNRSTTVTGSIEEGCGCSAGILTKVGAGTLTLTGTNGYTGATNVNGGVLNVIGSIASSSGVAVNNGGVLSGNGRVSDVIVKSGGILSPGTVAGTTLRIQGNVEFKTGSGYLLHISPTQASRAAITGTAKLAGTVFTSLGSGSYVTRQYTILTAAGGRVGKFNDVQLVNGTGFLSSLSYTGTSVLLNLKANLGGGRQTRDSQGVANALNNFFNNGGALPAAFLPVFGLSGAAQAKALSQLTGQTSANATGTGVQATNVFLTQMLNPFGGGPNGNVAESGAARSFAAERHVSPEAAATYAALTPNDVAAHFGQRWSLWGAAFGGQGHLNGTAGSQDVSIGSYGVATGADYRLDAATTLGFAVSGGHMNWTTGGGLGSGDNDFFQVGVSGNRSWGPAYIGAALAAGWHGMSTDRTVTLPGGGRLRADFDAHTFGGRIEAGYRTGFSDIGITPYAAIQALYVDLPAYGERPAGNPFALNFASRSGTAVRTELGSWFERTMQATENGVLVGRARLAWVHDEASSANVTATFQALPGANFVVNGAAAPQDSALLTAAAELRFRNNLSLNLRADSEIGSGAFAYALRGEIKRSW